MLFGVSSYNLAHPDKISVDGGTSVISELDGVEHVVIQLLYWQMVSTVRIKSYNSREVEFNCSICWKVCAKHCSLQTLCCVALVLMRPQTGAKWSCEASPSLYFCLRSVFTQYQQVNPTM